jgi:hypothetical protein
MRRTVGGVLLLLLVLPALRAEDKPKDKPKDKLPEQATTPAERLKALRQEYNTTQQTFFKEYQTAKTDEERQKLFQEKYPQPAKYAPRFLELAEKNPKDPAAVEALVWIVSNGQAMGGKDNPRAKALAILGRDHLASDKIGAVCDTLVYSQDAESETFLHKVLDKNPSRDVQGRACLDLGMYLNNRQKAKEAEEFLDRASKKYADVKHPFYGTVGKKAENMLYEVRFLTVGKTAPEVTGQDQDGKEFKLSDYRGKVVLVDFWGNW